MQTLSNYITITVNYKFISITPKSIDQHVEVRLLARLDKTLTTILDDFPEDLIPIISAYVINDQVSFYKQIIDTFLKTHKKAAKTRIRLDSEQIDRLSMYLLYQLLEPDIPDITSLETYFFEPINIIGNNIAGLYDGTGVTSRLICGYIRITTGEYEMGTFVDGHSFHGHGTYYYNGCIIREGEYNDGKCHGQGTEFRADGSVEYRGKFKDDKRHGQGTSYRADGSVIYKGEFKDGKRHGQGTSYGADGSVLYKGEWKDGHYHGQGTAYRADGSLYYEGEWKDGKGHAQGTVYRADGSVIYEGECKNGKPHGQGTYYWTDGRRYEGQWKDNKQHGQGTLYRADGNVVHTGEYKDGKRHGQGTSYRADGSVEYRGKWKNNQPDHSRSLTSKISSFFQ